VLGLGTTLLETRVIHGLDAVATLGEPLDLTLHPPHARDIERALDIVAGIFQCGPHIRPAYVIDRAQGLFRQRLEPCDFCRVAQTSSHLKFDAILIAGTTASGKSHAALELAKLVDGVIINADSMQVYREARILTARPSDAEMSSVTHRLYGHVSAREAYSTGRYQSDAAAAFAEARQMQRVPIFVGGTGLYFNALTRGLSAMPVVPAAVRAAARATLDEIGNERFHEELASRDPELALQLRTNDRQRLLRAFEVFEASGKPLSYWQKHAGEPVLAGLRLATFVLELPRALLHERIAARFGDMIEKGAIDEALALVDFDPTLPAAKIIGRPELLACHQGLLSKEEAVTRAIAATRRYAKRQDTWFRNQLADWPRIDATDRRNIVTKMLPFV